MNAFRCYLVVFTLLLMAPAIAAVPEARPYVSPEIHSDNSVTFRILAPQAHEVTLEGGWMTAKETVPLNKDDKGLWSVTIPSLEPTVYAYWLHIDGAVVLDQANQKVRERAGGSSTSTLDIPGDTPWAVRDVPHGSVELRWLKSSAFDGQTRPVRVYLPPGYRAEAKTRYPVLYLFHGAGELELSWTESGMMNFILDNLIADGKAKPMIVIMPLTSPSPVVAATGTVTTAGNSSKITKASAYVTETLIPWAERQYRIRPGQDSRALAGLSAGGLLASTIAFKNPQITHQLGVFSSPLSRFAEQFPEAAASPSNTNKALPLIWIATGRNDPGITERLRIVDRDMTALYVAHIYTETDGAHDYAVWRWCLSQFLPLLFPK
jgi:enterochelin esterase-like enzyme